jgi:tetratricopeptide (TPR) repeat protein
MTRPVLVLLLLASSTWLAAAPPAKANPSRREAIDLLAQGQALEQERDYEGAIALYARSVETAPSAAAYYQLGKLYRERGDRANARTYLSQALELNPEYELAKIELAKIENSTSDQPMNVDQIQREYETITSLRVPVGAPLPTPGSYPTGQSNTGRFFGFIPRAPQNPGAGAQPGIPRAAAQPTAPGTARQNLIPPDTILIEHDARMRVMVPGADDPQRVMDERNVAQRIAVPQPVTTTDPNQRISPQFVPAQEPDPRVRIARDGGATGAQAGGGLPTVEEINRAAFHSESAGRVDSIGYGNTTEIALNTFAFHRERADSYRTAKRWRDAAVEYRLALALDPCDTETRALLAEALTNAGDAAGAQAEFARAEAEAPDDPRAQYRKGNMYRDQGKPDLAIGAYRRALRIDPDYMFAHNNLGVVYMEKGEYTEAVKHFKRVLDLDPGYEKAMLNLGIIYDDHLGNKSEALKYYEMYLERRGERSAEVRRWAEGIRRSM